MSGPKLLTLDAGNTRLKWGVAQDERWLVQDALPLQNIVTLPGLLPDRPDLAVIANVAGDDVAQALQDVVAALAGPACWVTARRQQCGITSAYDDPEQLGADRWAARIGAWYLHRGPSLVVNSGTATTIDVLDANGVFQGGLILPGLELMHTSLARNTAQLKQQPGSVRALPHNTADAIASGCLQAQLGAVQRMFRHLGDDPAAQCLISGGAGRILFEHIDLPRRLVPNLVLEGLARIGMEALAGRGA